MRGGGGERGRASLHVGQRVQQGAMILHRHAPQFSLIGLEGSREGLVHLIGLVVRYQVRGTWEQGASRG